MKITLNTNQVRYIQPKLNTMQETAKVLATQELVLKTILDTLILEKELKGVWEFSEDGTELVQKEG